MTSTRVFEAACNIYQALESQSRNATEGKLYEGSLKAPFVENPNVRLDYYQKTIELLKAMGCISVLRPGHGRNPSLVHLIREPTQELYNEYRENRSVKAGTGTKTAHTLRLEQQIADLTERIKTLEKVVATLEGVVRFRDGS